MATPFFTGVLAGAGSEFSATEIDDGFGNAFTIDPDGQLDINGVPMAGTANITELYYIDGVIWRQDTSGNSYQIIDHQGTLIASPYPYTTNPVLAQTINLPPEASGDLGLQAGQDFDDSIVFSSAAHPQHAAELDLYGSNTLNSFTAVGSQGPGTGTNGFGLVWQGPGANLDLTNGVQLNNGDIYQFVQDGGTVSLEGTSSLQGGSLYAPQIQDDNGTLLLNGTIDVGALGKNTLNLTDINVVGGVIVQQGEEDVTQLGQSPPVPNSDDENQTGTVTNTVFVLDGGVLSFLYPAGFNGTIGPINATPNAPSMGFLAQIDIEHAMTTASASFDTTTGMLSLLDSSSNDLGDFHFAGNASGLVVNLHATSGLLTINDEPGSSGGNIPLTFHA